MNDNRSAGWLLTAGNLLAILVMIVHPVAGHGRIDPQAMGRFVLLDRVAHGFAIAGVTMVFLGAMALARELAGAGRLALAALVTFGFAAVAIMIAAAMSGFVGADILSRLTEGDPKLESRRMLLDYTFRINQAFASIYSVGTCVAIVLWSAAILKTRRFPSGLAIYGLVLGVVVPAALFGGWLTLDVHGMGLVVLAQAIWFVIAGVSLAGAQTDPELARPRA